MFIALLLTILISAGGALASYLYDDDTPPALRLCVGACLGLAAFGLFGFVLSFGFGLRLATVLVSACLTASPFLLLLRKSFRERILRDLVRLRTSIEDTIRHTSLAGTGTLLYFMAFAVLMYLVFDRAMFEKGGAIFTGELNNYGDLPFHFSIITSFAKGQNFPPEDPTFAGVRFTYPFIVDLVTAMFMRAGANLRDSMLLENFVLAISTVGVLYQFGLVLTRDRLAAVFTPLIVIFSGGFGWLKLFRDVQHAGSGIFRLLFHLPADEYTIVPNSSLRWGNMITALLLPQRSLLMGLPLAIIVFTEWWKFWSRDEESSEEKREESLIAKLPEGRPQVKKKKQKLRQASQANIIVKSQIPLGGEFRIPIRYLRELPAIRVSMLAAGLIAGMLPLVHAHTFVAMMVVGGILTLISGRQNWPSWGAFFFGATIIGAPQMLWAVTGSAVHTGRFFAFEPGWDHANANVLWFWLENTGVFIPLLLIALLWRLPNPFIPKRLLIFYLPFTICFIIPNLFKLAPWLWDNIKILVYWWVVSAPIVALLIAKLWRRDPAWFLISITLLFCLTFAGALDVWRIASRQVEIQEIDRDAVAFAEKVDKDVPTHSMILHAATHNHPMFLTGRRSVMGYPGHVWTHGLDFKDRETDIRVMYAGGFNAVPLMKKYAIDYVVVSPIEKNELDLNNRFIEENFTKVEQVGEYRLYKFTAQ